MLFTSSVFYFFLPAAVLIYFLIPFRFRNFFLLIASYVFYSTWRPEFLILLILSTGVDFFAAKQIEKSENKIRKKRFLLLSLSANLGMLFCFKYLDFFNSVVFSLIGFAGVDVVPPAFNIILPLGISFYTFQSLSYTLDVYWGRRKHETSLVDFAVYVSFFPQLIAGPIERSTTLLPQLKQKIDFSIENLISGSRLVIWGLFKKIMIANTLALIIVEPVFADPERYTGLVLSMASAAFAIQVYLDFSAYSDIAIGAARIMGIKLMTNFNRPLISKNFKEFWQRWHISLTTWLFDYAYKPIAMSLRSNWKVSVMVIFFLTGLWHGAGWGFIIFGLLHGIYYILSDPYQELTDSISDKIKWSKPFIDAFSMCLVFVLLSFSVIFFRAESTGDAGLILSKMFNHFTSFHFATGKFKVSAYYLFILLVGVLPFIFIHWRKHFDPQEPFKYVKFRGVRWIIYSYIILAMLYLGHNNSADFIYFQF